MRNKYAEQILERITPEDAQKYHDKFVRAMRVRYARIARRKVIFDKASISRSRFIIEILYCAANLNVIRKIIKPK